jgi:hypothetical protein
VIDARQRRVGFLVAGCFFAALLDQHQPGRADGVPGAAGRRRGDDDPRRPAVGAGQDGQVRPDADDLLRGRRHHDLRQLALDLPDQRPSGGEAFAQSEVEAYCQTTAGTVVQCANITAEGEIATGGTFGTMSYDKSCGHQHGACPTGRETLNGAWVAVSAEGDGTCGQVLDSNAQVWSVAIGGETSIELPGSDDTYTLSLTSPNDGTNESTGHYFVCS